MFPPEFSRLARVAGEHAPSLPASASAPRTNAFGTLFGEVSAEVADFIENGSASPAGTALSAEGRARQARLLAAQAPATGSAAEGPQAFLAAIAPLASEAGERLGVSPEIIAAHAALESGWGQRSLRQANGGDTHNFFGIKAGAGWPGEQTTAATTEYENGVPQSRSERFRSYPDTAGAFRDFAKLMLNNPRYQGVLNAGNDVRAYAQGLVRGGYATDPAYADKLERVAARLQSGD